MSVYDSENFAGRVALAASYISAERDSNRTFDTCFEMDDGDAVALALYRRTLKRPDTALARNIWKYLSRESVERVAIKYASETNLADLAARIRETKRAAFAGFMAYLQDTRACPTYHDGTPRKDWHDLSQAERETWIKNPTPRTYRTELTPAGEQAVIPGCERNASPRAVQLDLF